MISKLLSLLSTAKGAAAATILAAGAVGTGVVATNSDLQNTIGLNTPSASESPRASASGQPAIVAARNDADKALRDAFQNDQQKLEKLRGTQVQGADRQKLNDIVGTADDQLRARLTKALNDVAALTLGREGLEASGSPAPSASPKPSSSPDVKASFTAASQAQVDAIVKAAIADMDKIASDAGTAVGALPTANPGKPSDVPGGKPSDVPGASDHPTPAAPSAKPTR